MAVNVEITINGQRVWLKPGTRVRRERHNPAIEPNKILGQFVYSIEIPVENNEVVMQFVHTIEAGSATVNIPGVKMRIGAEELLGALILHRADIEKNLGSIQADFAATGFDVDIETTMLQDLDLPEYDMGSAKEDIALDAIDRCTAEQSDFRFPTMLNNDFYREDENKSLYVKFYPPETKYGERRAPDRCVLNQYDPFIEFWTGNFYFSLAGEEFPATKGVFNFTTLVPCFHLTRVVEEVMYSLGYTAKGSLFSHEELVKTLLSSNYSLDRRAQADKYARVGNFDSGIHIGIFTSQVVPYGAIVQALENHDDPEDVETALEDAETPGNFYDWHTLNIMDTTGGVFEDDDDLVHTDDESPFYVYNYEGTDDLILNIDARLEVSWGDGSEFYAIMRIKRIPAGGGAQPTLDTAFLKCSKTGDDNNTWFQFQHSVRVSASDLTTNDQIYVQIGEALVEQGSGSPYVEVKYFDLEFSVTNNGDPDVNLFEGAVRMINHLPKWTVKEFLINLRKLFNLDIEIHSQTRIASFNFAKDQLARTPIKLSFDVARFEKKFVVPKKMTFDFTRRNTIENEPAHSNFISPDWQNIDSAVGQYWYDPRTMRYYRRKQETGDIIPVFSWDDIGEKAIGQKLGAGDVEDIVVNPQFTPTEMGQLDNYPNRYWTDEDQNLTSIIAPVISEYGTKPGLDIVGDDPGAFLMFWLGMQHDADGQDYPLASPWGYDYNGVDHTGLRLSWSGSDGLYATFWEPWAKFLLSATPFEIDIHAPQAEIDKIFANKKIYYQGQEFIIRASYEEDLGEFVHAHLKLLKIEKE